MNPDDINNNGQELETPSSDAAEAQVFTQAEQDSGQNTQQPQSAFSQELPAQAETEPSGDCFTSEGEGGFAAPEAAQTGAEDDMNLQAEAQGDCNPCPEADTQQAPAQPPVTDDMQTAAQPENYTRQGAPDNAQQGQFTPPYNGTPYYGGYNYPAGGNPTGQGGFYMPYTPPKKEKLSTPVKVLIGVGIFLAAAFLVGYIVYWAVCGNGSIFGIDPDYFFGDDYYGDYYDEYDDYYDYFYDEDPTQPSVSTANNRTKAYTDESFSLELVHNDIDANEQSNARKAFDKVAVSTVAVTYSQYSYGDDYDVIGSGIVLTEDGYILTNSHVISDGTEDAFYGILLSDQTYLRTAIVGYDVRTDLAVLKVYDAEGQSFTPAEFADSDELYIGESVIAVGNPGGINFQNSLSDGVVSAVGRTASSDKLLEYIQTNAAINPGNSGGPLANFSGQVVGVNTAKIADTNYEGMGFAIPSQTVKSITEDIVRYGFVQGRVRLGIYGRAVSADEAERFTGIAEAGIYIAEINEDGPLDGFDKVTEGCVITALDSQEVENFSDVYRILENYSPGDTITVTVSNPDGGSYEVDAVLEADE